jgi:hypothetical protein
MAQMAREEPMIDDSRIVKLETQMAHVQSDITELKGEVKFLAKEFGAFRIEVATRFGAVDTRLESVNTSLERMNTSIERMNTSMERNTRWLLGAGFGALATVLGMLGHALKWF